jgi:hypothetical protein
MTAALPFTEKKILRAVRGALKAGIEIGGIAVRPDGTIMILSAVQIPPPRVDRQESPLASWDDL